MMKNSSLLDRASFSESNFAVALPTAKGDMKI